MQEGQKQLTRALGHVLQHKIQLNMKYNGTQQRTTRGSSEREVSKGHPRAHGHLAIPLRSSSN